MWNEQRRRVQPVTASAEGKRDRLQAGRRRIADRRAGVGRVRAWALGSAGDANATTNAIHSNNNYADAAMYEANAGGNRTQAAQISQQIDSLTS